MASRFEDHSKTDGNAPVHFHHKNFPTVFLTDFFHQLHVSSLGLPVLSAITWTETKG
jgi:hypothetical protein